MIYRVSGFILLCLINICAAYAQSVNLLNLPDIGDSDRANLTQADARFIGHQVVSQLNINGQTIKDYDTIYYLTSLGDNLASYSPLAGQNLTFCLINNKAINAFALPGGYVCVYNGLLASVSSESELAAVLSHELGHLIQHHIFRNIAVYKRNQWVGVAGLIAGGLLTVVNPGLGILAAQSSQGIAVQNILSFSRDFENEADRVGQDLMYQAGYDPRAMPAFFATMEKQNQFDSNDSYAFLQTHPVTSKRLAESMERASQYPEKMHVDSISFVLIHEKSRVRQLGAKAAIDFYKISLAKERYSKIDAIYYGMADAYFVKNDFKQSLSYLNKIKDSAIEHSAIVYNLKAKVLLGLNQYKQADILYSQALKSYPDYKALWLGQVDLYITDKKYKQAASQISSLLQSYPHDDDLWQKEALIYSDSNLNIPSKYHYALGNQYYYLGAYKLALQQYMAAIAAIKANKASNGEQGDIISSKIIQTQNQIKYQQQFITG